MKYIYGVFIGLVAIIALVWVIQLGIAGKPIAKIKMSEFTSSVEAAEAIAMRLRQELKDHQIVVLGVDPDEPEHMVIWREFLKRATEPGWKYDEVIVEKGLITAEPWGLGEQRFDIKEQESRFKSLWSSVDYKDKRIALVVPHIYASQLIKDNPVQRLKIDSNDGRILSISIVPLGENNKAPEIQRVPCSPDGSDYTGQSPLGCVIVKKATFHGKPLKEGVRQGLMEQFGLHDYIFFFRPVHSSNKD